MIEQTNAHVRANYWRGCYVAKFAEAEFIVSEALAYFAPRACEGGSDLLPHLIGQRFAALAAVVGVGGSLADIGRRVAKRLENWDQFRHLRTYLCHGNAYITSDHRGGWLMDLGLINFQGRQITNGRMTLREREADLLLDELTRATCLLDGELRTMKISFERFYFRGRHQRTI